MLKKIILIFIIPFLLTGCASISYDLEIGKDLDVLENVFITGTESYFNNFYKDYPKTIVMEWYNNESYKKELNDNNYNHSLVTEDVFYPGILVNKKYNTLFDYANNTIFKGQSFKNIICVQNDNLITIKSEGFIPFVEDEDDGGNPISELTINIKLPYVVIDNNADSYNSKTNTYSWYINFETDDKEIKLTFDKDKIYVNNIFMYISIIILCIIGLVLFFVIRKIVKNHKINNKILE